MANCPICGKSQGPKCEGGEVRYLSGLFPCAKLGGHHTAAPDPWYDRPKPVFTPEPVYDAVWDAPAEPSSDGLEDLL